MYCYDDSILYLPAFVKVGGKREALAIGVYGASLAACLPQTPTVVVEGCGKRGAPCGFIMAESPAPRFARGGARI